jgi:hypothetical protein
MDYTRSLLHNGWEVLRTKIKALNRKNPQHGTEKLSPLTHRSLSKIMQPSGAFHGFSRCNMPGRAIERLT